MNFRKKIIIIILFSVLFNTYINSQKKSIYLLSRAMKDSIMLRWAPSTPDNWDLGNKYGYILERYTILQKGKLLDTPYKVLLTPDTIKLAELKEWEKESYKNKYVAIAAECIFNSKSSDIPAEINPNIVYKKYQQKIQRYSFALYSADMSIKAAKLSGLYFVDNKVKKEEKYLYRIYLAAPDSIQQDTASVFVGVSSYLPLPQNNTLKAEWLDKKVRLNWNSGSYMRCYVSYEVERSIDFGKSFYPLGENISVSLANKNKYTNLIYKEDSLIDNNQTVYYRIRGINSFGQKGPYSNIVSGKGKVPLSKFPTIILHDVIDNNKVNITWDFPKEMNNSINGFRIYRSKDSKDLGELIYNGKESSQRKYIDTTALNDNYYRISAYNSYKEKLSPLVSYSALIDSLPPMPPKNLSGEIDSLGMVTLKWLKNTEADISGYRLYSSDLLNQDFMPVIPSQISDTIYKHKINLATLNNKIHYRISAVDFRQNESKLSEILTLTRPDILPPVSPLLNSIIINNNLPHLQWINSSSKDAVLNKIMRSQNPDSLFVCIKKISLDKDSIDNWTDSTILSNSIYYYKIIAVDKSGLESKPSKVKSVYVNNKNKKTIKLECKKQLDSIILKWILPSNKQYDKVLIYKKINNAPLRIVGNSIKNSYTDKMVKPGNNYKYRIRILYKDGTYSKLSNNLIINY